MRGKSIPRQRPISRKICEEPASHTCALFCTLKSSPQWDVYLQATHRQAYPSHQIIFCEGDKADVVHLLCQGEVKLVVSDRLDHRRIVHLISGTRTPCDILDKACLSIPAYSVTCETLKPCQICCLSRSTFLEFLREHPGFALGVMNVLGAEVGHLMRDLQEDSTLSARGRLAKGLLNLVHTHGVPMRKGIAIGLSLRRQELAELIGTTRETVTRLLSEFSRRNIVTLEKRAICVLEPDRLATIVRRAR